MDLSPVCEAAKPLVHSFPWIPWWLGLNAAEQGAWVSGLGAFAAAFAAVAVVVVGYRRDRREKRARGRLVAAYLYMPMSQLRAALLVIESEGRQFASVTAGSASSQVSANAGLIASACERTRHLLDTFNIADAAYLPRDIGERLATGIMESRFLFDRAQGATESYFAAERTQNPDLHRFMVAHECNEVPQMAAHARDKIDTFIAFCISQFGTEQA